MALDARATVFVTGAAGFLGMALIEVLVARGYRVFALAESMLAADRVRHAGAVPVLGDLLEQGAWQDEAGAEVVFHLPPDPLGRGRVTGRTARRLSLARVSMDAHLLDAVGGGATRRIVYVASTSCYRVGGPRPAADEKPLRLSKLGQHLAPALNRLEGYTIAGWPIVTAMPGWVYGDGSWFRRRVIDPVLAGRRVLQFGRVAPWVSPIHVDDCARALVHLAEHAEPGGRYFLVNSDPVRAQDFAATFARLVKRRLRVWRVPTPAVPLVAGSVLAEYLVSDAVFSNVRLRGTGFRFRYPTLEDGLEQVAKFAR